MLHWLSVAGGILQEVDVHRVMIELDIILINIKGLHLRKRCRFLFECVEVRRDVLMVYKLTTLNVHVLQFSTVTHILLLLDMLTLWYGLR